MRRRELAVGKVSQRHRTEAQGDTKCMGCPKTIRVGDVYAIAEIAVDGGTDACIVCYDCGERMRQKK